MVRFEENVAVIENESNMINNKKERNFLNISLKDYSKIVRSKNIEVIVIVKKLYINNSYCTSGFLAERYSFLNMNISKGKTKKYIRVKFDAYTKEKLKEIEKNLIENEREVA